MRKPTQPRRKQRHLFDPGPLELPWLEVEDGNDFGLGSWGEDHDND